MTSSKLSPLLLGDLPTFQLAEFGIKLPDGTVVMSIAAQKHSISRHGDDFWKCAPYLAEVVETPSAVGQSPHHKDACELIKEIDSSGFNVLVAVNVEATSSGIYMVRSAYPIDMGTIERRVRKGFLRYV